MEKLLFLHSRFLSFWNSCKNSIEQNTYKLPFTFKQGQQKDKIDLVRLVQTRVMVFAWKHFSCTSSECIRKKQNSFIATEELKDDILESKELWHSLHWEPYNIQITERTSDRHFWQIKSGPKKCLRTAFGNRIYLSAVFCWSFCSTKNNKRILSSRVTTHMKTLSKTFHDHLEALC